MKIALISGLSGSGKGTALKCLEDAGYYCVDNMPTALLPDLAALHRQHGSTDKLGISVDIRSQPDSRGLREHINALKQAGHQVDVLFLEAEDSVLQRRFAETRRSHPLSADGIDLTEALRRERERLQDVRSFACCIDTSQLSSHQLRRRVRQWLQIEDGTLLVSIESFGFKHGILSNADFVFDVRSLPNPYYQTELRPRTGLDAEVQNYLAAQPLTADLIRDIEHFLRRWLPHMQADGRTHVTVGIGCTGGQHRSVYVAETLGGRLADGFTTWVRHRQLP